MAWGASLDLSLLQRQAPGLVLFALTMALAVLLLYRVRGTPASKVFAIFLLLRGAANLVAVLRASSRAAEDVALWHQVQPYFFLPLPFLVAAFVATFPRRRGWLGSPAGLAALGGAAVGADLLYALDHGLYFTYVMAPLGDQLRAFITGTGPLYLLLALLIPAYAVAALLFHRAAARAPDGPGRRAGLLVALGFALDPLFLGLLMAVRGVVAGLPVEFAFRDGVGNPFWIAAVPLPIVGLRCSGARARATRASAERRASTARCWPWPASRPWRMGWPTRRGRPPTPSCCTRPSTRCGPSRSRPW